MKKEVIDFIYNRHDIYCNQKYGYNLPYSFHLKSVLAQGEQFIDLIPNEVIGDKNNSSISLRDIVRYILIFHDALEDARLTYNDLLKIEFGNSGATQIIANTVYCLTDEKGKNRSERKNEKYYKELKANEIAVFAKLADISANTLYSKLTGSSMYDKYKKEFPLFKDKVYLEKYREFFNYVENL